MKMFLSSRTIQGAIIGAVAVILVGFFVKSMATYQVTNERSVNSPVLIQSPSSTVAYNLPAQDRTLQEYAYVASLYPDGSDQHVNYPLTISGPLYDMLKGTYQLTGDNFFYKCDSKSLEVFKQVIQQEPEFPFSYFALAVCGKQSGTKDWITYAEKGLQIVQITTRVGVHKPEHDQVLQYLTKMLQ